jgi:hypothetical protein
MIQNIFGGLRRNRFPSGHDIIFYVDIVCSELYTNPYIRNDMTGIFLILSLGNLSIISLVLSTIISTIA